MLHACRLPAEDDSASVGASLPPAAAVAGRKPCARSARAACASAPSNAARLASALPSGMSSSLVTRAEVREAEHAWLSILHCKLRRLPGDMRQAMERSRLGDRSKCEDEKVCMLHIMAVSRTSQTRVAPVLVLRMQCKPGQVLPKRSLLTFHYTLRAPTECPARQKRRP